MARKTRITTSVSTLVNDLSYLNDLCRVAGRKDLQNGMGDLTKKVNKLVHEYNDIRMEVDSFKAAILTPKVEKENEKVTATA